MLKIRKYRESDAISVGILIHDTYSKFNLSFASPDEQKAFLGPFQHARSDDQAHRDKIAQVIRASMVFVAENDGEIVGVLRGRADKMQSLFVSEACHRQGVGRKLVERFEQECLKQNASVIKLMGTLYATPFYQAVGYKKSTGVRSMRTFDGVGLPYQPMKKSSPSPDLRTRSLLTLTVERILHSIFFDFSISVYFVFFVVKSSFIGSHS